MANSVPFEFIFLGSGTSTSLPHLDCLTAPPERERCVTCWSSTTPEGWKNRRRNTSGIVRTEDKDGNPITIVIDAGKTFLAGSLDLFPKNGLRKIDALLLTHGHADAMNGLDDLRGWTLRGAIQHHIDIYASQQTFQEVERSFPYLVSKEFASGGGDVPDFVWHIIEDGTPFEINSTGITVTPFMVEHGRIRAKHVIGQKPVPITKVNTVLPTAVPNGDSCGATIATPANGTTTDTFVPYHCFGFRFGPELIYISDVSSIPPNVWQHLAPPPALLVLDCLRPEPFTSHFGIHDAVESARRIGANKTLLIGFSHDLMQDEWEIVCQAAEGKRPDAQEKERLRKCVTDAIDMIDEGRNVWVRPAHDGMRVKVQESDALLLEQV